MIARCQLTAQEASGRVKDDRGHVLSRPQHGGGSVLLGGLHGAQEVSSFHSHRMGGDGVSDVGRSVHNSCLSYFVAVSPECTSTNL